MRLSISCQNKGFGSVTFYPVGPDQLDLDPPEKLIRNTSDNRILELGRHIVKTVKEQGNNFTGPKNAIKSKIQMQ